MRNLPRRKTRKLSGKSGSKVPQRRLSFGLIIRPQRPPFQIRQLERERERGKGMYSQKRKMLRKANQSLRRQSSRLGKAVKARGANGRNRLQGTRPRKAKRQKRHHILSTRVQSLLKLHLMKRVRSRKARLEKLKRRNTLRPQVLLKLQSPRPPRHLSQCQA